MQWIHWKNGPPEQRKGPRDISSVGPYIPHFLSTEIMYGGGGRVGVGVHNNHGGGEVEQKIVGCDVIESNSSVEGQTWIESCPQGSGRTHSNDPGLRIHSQG